MLGFLVWIESAPHHMRVVIRISDGGAHRAPLGLCSRLREMHAHQVAAQTPAMLHRYARDVRVGHADIYVSWTRFTRAEIS